MKLLPWGQNTLPYSLAGIAFAQVSAVSKSR